MHQDEAISEVDRAIAALEAQRAVLGDRVVDTALGPLRERRELLLAAAGEERRKQVTVLFADLVGFTALSESMDVEDVRALLSDYFTAWYEAIDAEGGVVEKYIGDAVMAVFGLHRAQEDDAERAVRAALVMRDRLGALNEQFRARHGHEIEMRVGVDTGEVVVGALGDRPGQDWVVVGDIVNRASRIQSVAPVGGILVSHDAFRLMRGVFDVEPLAPVALKGVGQPVPVYLVHGGRLRTFRRPARGLEGIETRTIGRERELAELKDCFDQVLEEGEPRIVTVFGEAGVGKSRVLYELEGWLDLIPDDVRYFKGRASPATVNQPNALIRDLMAFRFDIRDSDDPATVAVRLTAGFGEVFGLDEAGSSRSILLGRWLGFEVEDDRPEAGSRLDPQQLRDRALVLLAEYVRGLTVGEPVAVLLEDLHWADDSSLDLLDRLEEVFDAGRLFVVATARPTLFERRPLWGEGLARHQRVQLDPLSRRESRQLVAEILQRADHVPDELRDLVVAAAEGNPFYIEELLTWFIDQGVIDATGDRWQIDPERIGARSVPPTLKGVLQARLDALGPIDRAVLQRAAVFGRVFWDDAVRQVGDANDEAVGEVLDRLRQRAVIFERERSVFDGTRELVFRHALLRDVVYESLLRSQRTDLHGRAARWLAAMAERGRRADELASVIADHHVLAGDDVEATRWLLRAGLHAARVHAHAEALRLLGRGLELAAVDDVPVRMDLLLAMESVHDQLADRAAQQGDLAALDAALATGDDPARRAEVLLRHCRLDFFLSEFDLVADAAAAAIDLATVLDQPDVAAEANLWWGKALAWRGDHEAAARRLDLVVEHARQLGSARVLGDALRYRSIVASDTSHFEEAEELLEAARQVHRAVGDRHGEATVMVQMATVLHNMGRFAEARPLLEAALPVFEESGYRYGTAIVTSNLAAVAIAEGRLGQARHLLTRAVELNVAMQDREGACVSKGMLGDVARLVGDWSTARRHLERSIDVAAEVGFDYIVSDSLASSAIVTLAEADPTRALDEAARSVEHACRSGARHGEARSFVAQGEVLLALGRLGEAERSFARALQLQQELGQAHAKREAEAGLLEVHRRTGRAGAVHDVARRLAAELGVEDLAGALQPAHVLVRCHDALAAVGDPEAAGVRVAGRRYLDDMRARIDDEQMWDGFRRVPSVTALLELVAERPG